MSDMACRFGRLHGTTLKRAEVLLQSRSAVGKRSRRHPAEIHCQRGQPLRQVVVQFPGNPPALLLVGVRQPCQQILPLLLRHFLAVMSTEIPATRVGGSDSCLESET